MTSIKAIRNKCTAFSWDGNGQCRGVSLENNGNAISITGLWNAQCDYKPAALAENLANGKRALNVTEADYCLVSPYSGGWSIVDLEMPVLKGAELTAALAFELRKHTPLAPEQLTWGYRVLVQPTAQNKHQKIRLFYVKTETWRKWMTAVTGLGRVDTVVPAPVVLDPSFAEKTVTFPGKTFYSYKPSDNGREILPTNQDVHSLNELLPFEELNAGELETLPIEEQLTYIPAIVMAAYGMTRELGNDTRTLPQLPTELKPRRYQGYRLAAAVLCAIIAICLCFGLMQAMQLRMTRLRLIKKDISAVEKEIKSLQQNTNTKVKEAAKLLEEEMSRYQIDAPALPDVLIELTETINSPGWMAGPFTWSMDVSDSVIPVTFVLREPVGSTTNLDISTRLNNSPILGDVVETKSATNRAGYEERRFTLKARYDTEDEKEALEEYNRKKREEAAKAAKAAKADNADEDDIQDEEPEEIDED